MKELEERCRRGATEGRPVTVEELKAELRAIARGDDVWDEVAELAPDGLLAALKGSS